MNADEFLEDFVKETRDLVQQMQEHLEKAEGGIAECKNLETYGQLVDRIMGGATSLAMNLSTPNDAVQKIADYAAVCKAVGYKASQIKDNVSFYGICCALLMDSTEVLDVMLDIVQKGEDVDLKKVVSEKLIDRLKWVSGKFSAEYRESVAVKKTDGPKMSQNDIDALMAKLGLG
jgi:hypothetical protein